MSLLRRLVGKILPKPEKIAAVTDVSLLKTHSLPQEYWIELTSKCPFDCVFCSRSALRGKGEHMDFSLYQSVVSQMQSPSVIRLNYSGESIHYPQLREAIATAKATGARVELVTVLSSAKPKMVEALVLEGLDRLTISIHALSEVLYQDIYGHSSVGSLRENIALLHSLKQKHGSALPVIDFAFVAMEKNLDQLPSIVELADELGVQQIDIHPVIRRDNIPAQFGQELIAGNLTISFRTRLTHVLQRVSECFPAIDLNLSSKELQASSCLGELPIAFTGHLPQGAKIHSCEQNPWNTVHILANGDVVVCEVRDQIVMGNLKTTDLFSIWHGTAYRAFRIDYSNGVDEKCRTCIYKVAYLPQSKSFDVKTYLHPQECQQQLLLGWHPVELNHVWSSSFLSSAVVLKAEDASRLLLSGILPPAPLGEVNRLRVKVGVEEVSVANAGRENYPFQLKIPLGGIGGIGGLGEEIIVVEFETTHVLSPTQQGSGRDARRLGFALTEIICR